MKEYVPACIDNHLYYCFAQMCLQTGFFQDASSDDLQDAADFVGLRLTLMNVYYLILAF